MPELPEVETIARTLAPGIVGRVIAGIELIHRPLVRTGRKRLETMGGRRVLGVRRRGKMLLIGCEGGRTLVFHLKMTGQFLLAAASDERDKHTRLVIRFADGGNELRFSDVRKFGFLLCLEGDPESVSSELAGLGPEPLEISLPEFAGVLTGRRGRIKSLLLDQARIAGIGNIYADEMLFDARIHPQTPADLLDETGYRAALRVHEEDPGPGHRVERLDDPELPRRRRPRRELPGIPQGLRPDGGALRRVRNADPDGARRGPVEPFLPQVPEEEDAPRPKLKTGADSAIVRPIPLGAPVAQYG